MSTSQYILDKDGTLSALIVPPQTATVRVLVAICHNLGIVPRECCQSLMGLGWGNRIETAKALYGIAEISFAWFTKLPRVDALRDLACERAMQDGFTHLVFLDADMLHPDDLLIRLLKHVKTGALVSGFYTQRHYPYAPIAFRDSQPHESGLYRIYQVDGEYAQVDADGLREEELIGMGCALIPLDLVAQLGPRPWFEYKNDADGWPMVSEDVPFCEKIRAAGGRIVLDPSIKCGHLFTGIADENHFKRYLQTKADTEAKLQGAVTVRIDEGIEDRDGVPV